MRSIDLISDKHEKIYDVQYHFFRLVPEAYRGHFGVPCLHHVCVCSILWKDDAGTISVGKSILITADNEDDEMKKYAFLDAIKEVRKQWKKMVFSEFEAFKAAENRASA